MRIRYYACSIIWIYWALIIVVCLRPVRLSGDRTNFFSIQPELSRRHSPEPTIEGSSSGTATVGSSPSAPAVVIDDDNNEERENDSIINNINNHNNRAEEKQLTSDWMNLFEKQLITKMGMNNRPRPKRKIVIPDKLRELYNQLTTSNAYDVDDLDNIRVRSSFNPIWDSARSFFAERKFFLSLFLFYVFLQLI